MIETAIADGAKTAEITPSGSDRRAHVRLRAEALITLGARLASGAEIRLVDLSRSGAQFECDRRFLPGSTLSLRLVTADTTFVVSGNVVRSRIVRLSGGGLGYNVAVAFTELLQTLLEEPGTPSETAAASAHGTSAPDGAAPFDGTIASDIAAPGDTPALYATAPDVSAEEAAAFEAAALTAPAGFTVTAAVEQTGEELRDLFNGNDW